MRRYQNFIWFVAGLGIGVLVFAIITQKISTDRSKAAEGTHNCAVDTHNCFLGCNNKNHIQFEHCVASKCAPAADACLLKVGQQLGSKQ